MGRAPIGSTLGHDAREFDLERADIGGSGGFPGEPEVTEGFASGLRKDRERVFDFSSGTPKPVDDLAPGEFALDAEHSDAIVKDVASASAAYLVRPVVGVVGEADAADATEQARLRAKKSIAQARAQFETTSMTSSLVRLFLAVALAALAFVLNRSILHGQASWPWLFVQALALYLVRDALRGKGTLGWDTIVWAACTLAVSCTVNWRLTPRYTPSYVSSEAGLEAGELVVRRDGQEESIPLSPLHVVTRRVEHVGKRFVIREVWLRSATSDAGDPSVELFATIPELSDSDVIDGGRDLKVLRQLELPVATTGLLGSRSSRFSTPSVSGAIVEGSLSFVSLSPSDSGKVDAQRVEGRLDLQVETERGIELISGRFDVATVWDDPSKQAP